MSSSANAELIQRIQELRGTLQTAKRSKISLSSHQFYAPKAREQLAALRKSFLSLQRDYPKERFPGVAFQLLTVEPLINKVIELFPSEPKEMLTLLTDVEFKVKSDLAAELDGLVTADFLSSKAPYLPESIIDTKHRVMNKVLWEINRSYNTACYNACAAMIRRLLESLIIQSFEHQGISKNIKQGQDYVKLGKLIGKVTNEHSFNLTRNAKKALPNLKFFGDISVHNRNILVRKEDLDRLHQQVRITIEELSLFI